VVAQVHGVSLDLVNLRSETYTQDSRIPGAIQFGTPEQVRSHFARGAPLASRRGAARAAACLQQADSSGRPAGSGR
jgi:hypothetical protein